METFLIRFLIALVVVLLFEKLIAVLTFSEQAKQIFNVILILAAILFAIFGSVLIH